MLFAEKLNRTQNLTWKYQPGLEVKVMGTTEEEYNYRNKSVYTFNLFDAELDKFSFSIIGMDHVKIIQYINLVVNQDYRVKSGKFGVHNIYIKNNWKQEFQICLGISCLEDSSMTEMVKFLFQIVQKVIQDLNVSVISGYYYVENRKVTLKEKEFHLFFGEEKLEECVEIKVGDRFTMPRKVWLSPYSFSRVNYQNSCLIYQKVWEVCRGLEAGNHYVLFGRDLYFPLKVLESVGNADGFYGITHCPITYRDILADKDADYSARCKFVEKREYAPYISRHLDSGAEGDKKFVFVLTASRNGLGSKMCQMLLDYHDRIKMIIYIACSIPNVKKDLDLLVPNFQIKEINISNEFSHTAFNNNLVVLE